MDTNMSQNDSTAHINACCLNRWICEVNGKPRPEAMPCGFEMVGTVEGCAKAIRMQSETLDLPRPAIG